MKNKIVGFTIAEVLLATLVLGVVISLTVPSLNASYQQKLTITKLQKLLTQFESYYHKTALEFENPEKWSSAEISPQAPINYFLNKVDVIKYCEPDTYCPTNDMYFSLDGTKTGSLFSSFDKGCAILNDGSFICMDNTKNYCKTWINGIDGVCGSIYVDVNGKKSPNQLGIDTFRFYYTKDRIVPAGAASYKLVMHCNKEYKDELNGFDCTSWVLEKENFDFIKNKIH